MNDNLLKKIAKATYFRNETVRRIAVGPMRGMVYRINDITGLSPWYSGTERDHQKAFKRLVKPGDVVMDVGANWGIHTLLLSKLVGPSGLVIALEPLPQAVDSLNGVSNTATVTITVNSVNDPPVAANDSYSTNEDTTLNGASVLGNDSDSHNSAAKRFLAWENLLPPERLLKARRTPIASN